MARPVWTLTEAVARTGVSRSTLRRQLDAGKFPGAYKDRSNACRFPLEDLLAAGLSVSAPPSEQAQSAGTEQPTTDTNEQVNKLEQALALERSRADNAERLAASYLDNVQDLRRALLMLGAGTSQPEQTTDLTMSVISEQAIPAPVEIIEPTALATSKGGYKPSHCGDVCWAETSPTSGQVKMREALSARLVRDRFLNENRG